MRRRVVALPPGKPQRPVQFLRPSWSTSRLSTSPAMYEAPAPVVEVLLWQDVCTVACAWFWVGKDGVRCGLSWHMVCCWRGHIPLHSLPEACPFLIAAGFCGIFNVRFTCSAAACLPTVYFSSVSDFLLRYVLWLRSFSWTWPSLIGSSSLHSRKDSFLFLYGKILRPSFAQCWWNVKNLNCLLRALKKYVSGQKIGLRSSFCVRNHCFCGSWKVHGSETWLYDRDPALFSLMLSNVRVLLTLHSTREPSALAWVRQDPGRRWQRHPPERVRSLAVWMLQCSLKCPQNVVANVFLVWLGLPVIHWRTLKVCMFYLFLWHSAFFGENPPRPKGLNCDVSAVPCDRCGVIDSFAGRALTFYSLPVAPTSQSSSSPSACRWSLLEWSRCGCAACTAMNVLNQVARRRRSSGSALNSLLFSGGDGPFHEALCVNHFVPMVSTSWGRLSGSAWNLARSVSTYGPIAPSTECLNSSCTDLRIAFSHLTFWTAFRTGFSFTDITQGGQTLLRSRYLRRRACCRLRQRLQRETFTFSRLLANP